MEENEKMYLDWDGLQEYHLNIESELSLKVNSSDLANVATSGDYSDLNNTPTNVSLFTNDAGYLTSEIDNTNGHEYVEIGGLKWATMNIGATNITDIGLYFQWGDILGYTSEEVGVEKNFTWNDYKFNPSGDGETFTKYNSSDEKISLDLEDDPVASAWGSDWRTPTSADFQTFSEAVDTEWVSDYLDSGVSGLLCTDKEDSTKTIFFPAGGFCSQGSIIDEGGLYWTKSLANSKDKGIGIGFDDSNTSWNLTYNRCLGYCLRGILNGPNKRTVMGVTLAEKNTWNNKIENVTYINKTFVKTTNGINSNIVTTNTLKTDLELKKSDVGLENVTNDSLVKRSEMGTANGVATLDENGLILSTQLPSYVDDVIEAYYHGEEDSETGEMIYNMYEDPEYTIIITPESGKIYMDVIENITYRWGGSTYVPILGGVTLGETSSTAYRGDRGKIAYDHSQLTSGNPHNVTKSDVGLGNVGNFKAVSTVASQGLTDTEKSNARTNIGAGTYSKPSGGIPDTDLATSYLPINGGTMNGTIWLGNENNTLSLNYGLRRNGHIMLLASDPNNLGLYYWKDSTLTNPTSLFMYENDIDVNKQFKSTLANGTAPISVTSTTVCTNLNADLLDGQHGSYYAAASSVTTLQDYFTNGYANKTVDFDVWAEPENNKYDANVHFTRGYAGYLRNYNGPASWSNAPSGMTYGCILNLYRNTLGGELAWDINHGETATTKDLWWRARDNGDVSRANWKKILFTDSSDKVFIGNVFDINRNGSTGTFKNTNKTALEIEAYADYVGFKSYHNTANHAKSFYFNDKVGIGTNAPSYDLHVSGRIGLYEALVFTRESWNYISVPATNGVLAFAVGTPDSANTKMFINNSGNVGIGTISPSYKLDVSGDVQATNFRGALVGNASTATTLQTSRTLWGLSFNGSANVTGNMTDVGNLDMTGWLVIWNSSSKNYDIALGWRTISNEPYVNLYAYENNQFYNILIGETSGSNSLVYDASAGNWGIGTLSPSYKLHVNGDVGATNFYTTSDRSKKTNIEKYSEHISKFTLKETGKNAYGVIAQDIPEMFRNGEEGSYTVDYNSVLSYYVGTLENKVKMLEEKLAKIEKEISNGKSIN